MTIALLISVMLLPGHAVAVMEAAGVAEDLGAAAHPPLVLVLGSQWRWDDESLAAPSLRPYIAQAAKANIVVRTTGVTTDFAHGKQALLTGARDGQGEWRVTDAVAAQIDAGSRSAADDRPLADSRPPVQMITAPQAWSAQQWRDLLLADTANTTAPAVATADTPAADTADTSAAADGAAAPAGPAPAPAIDPAPAPAAAASASTAAAPAASVNTAAVPATATDSAAAAQLRVIDLHQLSVHDQVAALTRIFQVSQEQGWNVIATSLADVAAKVAPHADAAPAQNSGAAPAEDINGNPGGARLQACLALGADFPAGLLTSGSTHRRGLVQIADVTATVADYFGVTAPGQVLGKPIAALGQATDASADDAASASTVAQLASAARRAALIVPAQPIFFSVYGTMAGLIAIGGVWSLNRRVHRLEETWPAPRGLLRFWRTAGTCAALVAASSFWVNLVPWWQLGPAATDQAAATFAWFGALLPVLLAAAVTALWECSGLAARFSPAALIGWYSLGVGFANPGTGSALMLDAVIGHQSTVGARFYGVDNMMFAVFITGALLVIAVLAGRWGSSGSCARAAVGDAGGSGHSAAQNALMFAGLIALALAVIVFDAAPSLGADFGGILVAIPSFAVLFLKLRSRRFAPLSALLIALGGLLAAIGLACWDWRRPPRLRTHLGDFVDSVLRGELGAVLAEKATWLWRTAQWPVAGIAAIAVVIVAVLALLGIPLLLAAGAVPGWDYGWLRGSKAAQRKAQPCNARQLSAPALSGRRGAARRIRAGVKHAAARWLPAEKAFLWAWGWAMVLAALFNDSSVTISIVGLLIAGPTVLAYCAHIVLQSSAPRSASGERLA